MGSVSVSIPDDLELKLRKKGMEKFAPITTVEFCSYEEELPRDSRLHRLRQ